MALRGIDISNWQAGIDLGAVSGQVDFVIVKATEGVGFVDRSCDGFVQTLRAQGKPWGFYHFARQNDATAEADFFYENTRNYFRDGIPILDWEIDVLASWVNEFVARIHDLSGVWPWVYANPWRFNQGTVDENCGRWVAGYPSSGITDIGYGLTHDLPSSYAVSGTVAAWQFTSSGRLQGYGGNLDMNVFYGDVSAWRRYADPGSAVEEPDPKPPLPEALSGYVDLDSEAWYVDAVEEAVTRGYMTGYDPQHFGPSDPITRAQAVCAIARAAGAPTESPFSDVVASPFYYEAIEWAKAEGVVNGTNSEFRPDDPATRAEMACFLRNWKDGEAVGEPTGYPDWPEVPDFAKEAVAWAVEQGVISGSGGKLLPNAPCSRAEAAGMLANLLD